MRERFSVTGDVCIETNPADVDRRRPSRELHDCGVALVSLGVQSFRPESLRVIGRRYTPEVAERALALLAESDFASVNADIMFALPGQTAADVVADLEHAAELGADQLTTYPLFTFPYTAVGEYLHLAGVKMPDLAHAPRALPGDLGVVREQRLRARQRVGLQARRRAAVLVGHARRLHRHRPRLGFAPARRLHAEHLRSRRVGGRPRARATPRSRCACRSRAR